MNWEKGALRNLPYSYQTLVKKLDDTETGRIGFVTENETAYVTGVRLGDGRILSVSLPLGTVGGTVGILRMQLVWVSILSLALGFCLSWIISKRFGKPIAQISRSAKLIAKGNFRPEFPKGFCAELDELSDTLEETALHLEKAKNAQRDFLANVSHDLRTPLTMIKGYAEMVKEISWNDEEKREKDLDIIMRESDRLTALVNEILEFSAMQADGSARFAVTDYGKGITDEEIPYIWDRYYTSRNRKNKAAVSGLGLSIAKEILTAHRAKFGVDIENNCTFWFELQVCSNAAA